MENLIFCAVEEFSINLTVENIYFSDLDAVRIVIDKNTVDLKIIVDNWKFCINGFQFNCKKSKIYETLKKSYITFG